jgi:hypothetical protein
MTRNLGVILHWLRWSPGSGTLIRVGRDKICGMENSSLLSDALCLQLQHNHITHLAQASISDRRSQFPESWRSSESLNLCDQNGIEWSSFTLALREAGITLRNAEDSLVWAGGDASGAISASNLYRALISPLNFICDKPWITKFWKWPIQLKIRLFAWLAVFDKILTWDVLQRRGWVGPGICKLCNVNSKTTDHLLVHYPFTQAVWRKLYKIFHLNFQWEGTSVSDCFYKWTSDFSAPASMAAIACWHIWIERNKTLFEDFSPSLDSVVHRISASFSWQPSFTKSNQPMCHAIVLNNHTISYVYMFEYCIKRRGVGPGLSPDPRFYCINM